VVFVLKRGKLSLSTLTIADFIDRIKITKIKIKSI